LILILLSRYGHDISNHLPIFTVYDSNYILNRHGNKPISKRVREEETIEAFKVDLHASTRLGIYW